MSQVINLSSKLLSSSVLKASGLAMNTRIFLNKLEIIVIIMNEIMIRNMYLVQKLRWQIFGFFGPQIPKKL